MTIHAILLPALVFIVLGVVQLGAYQHDPRLQREISGPAVCLIALDPARDSLRHPARRKSAVRNCGDADANQEKAPII